MRIRRVSQCLAPLFYPDRALGNLQPALTCDAGGPCRGRSCHSKNNHYSYLEGGRSVKIPRVRPVVRPTVRSSDSRTVGPFGGQCVRSCVGPTANPSVRSRDPVEFPIPPPAPSPPRLATMSGPALLTEIVRCLSADQRRRRAADGLRRLASGRSAQGGSYRCMSPPPIPRRGRAFYRPSLRHPVEVCSHTSLRGNHHLY